MVDYCKLLINQFIDKKEPEFANNYTEKINVV